MKTEESDPGLEGTWAEELGCYILVELCERKVQRVALSNRPPSRPSEVSDAILGYLRGKDYPEDIELDMSGLTDFQLDVLAAASCIPRGKTVTYGQLATLAGHPRAARAVGRALAKNPFPLLIPCHRVVSRDGPGGYSYGRMLKERLLVIERTQK